MKFGLSFALTLADANKITDLFLQGAHLLFGEHSDFKSLTREEFTKLKRPKSPHPGRLYFLTSGSQGRPKLVAHTKESLDASAQSFLDFFSLPSGASWGLALPLKHTAGWMVWWRSQLNCGTIRELPKKWWLTDPFPEYLSLVPTQWQQMRQEATKEDLQRLKKNLKICWTGGGPISEDLCSWFLQEKLPVSFTYGLTENAATCSATKPLAYSNPQAIGRPLPGKKIFLDPDKQTLIIESSSLAESVDGVPLNGLYRTQDRAYEVNGEWFLLGRDDDTFISGGQNFSLSGIEDKWRQELAFPFHDVLAFKIPDPLWGERYGVLLFAQTEKKMPSSLMGPPKSLQRREKAFNIAWLYDQSLLHHIKKSRHLATLLFDFCHHSHFRYHLFGAWGAPVIVTFHGLFGGPDDWRDFLSLQTQKHFLIISLDLTSFPQSSAMDFSSLLQLLQEDMERLLSILKTPLHAMIGYSLGGRLLAHLLQQWRFSQKPLLAKNIFFFGSNFFAPEKAMDMTPWQIKLKNINNQTEADSFLQEWYRLPLFQDLEAHSFFSAWRKKRSLRLWRQKKQWISISHLLATRETPPVTSLKHLFSHHQARSFFYAGALDQKYQALGALWQQDMPSHFFRVIPLIGHMLLLSPEAAKQLHLDLIISLQDVLSD
jgi:pimeloyl-ACP methyl ester carboxylesterase